MKKSIFLFFAAILCAMTANAQWALMGTLTDWSSGKEMTVSGTTATCTVDLAGATQYELKVKNSGSWYGNGTTITQTTTTDAFNTSGGNVILKTTIPGTYTFSFNTSTKKLTVTYPEVPAPHDITVRAQVPAHWTNDIYAHVWTSENGSGQDVGPLTKNGDYYEVTKNAGALYVIFKNGSAWSDQNQTVDLVYTEDVCLQVNQSGTAKATATVIDCGAVSKDITVKAVVPGAWEETITAWVWPTGGEGKEVTPTKDGNWYVVTENCIELNVIFKNGTGWNGDANQTVNIEGVSENTCYQISALNKEGGKCSVAIVDCEAAIEPEAKPVDVYTIVGAETLVGTAWDFNNTDNDMTKQGDGSYVLVKENVELATTGTYEYKVVKNRSWDWKGVNEGNNLTLTGVDVDGTYNVTFTLNKELNALTASLELVEAKKVIPECYVAGDESLTGQDWNAKSVSMTYDEATEVYTATLTAVPAGTHNMKVVYGGEWLGFDHLATPAPANVKEGDDKKIQFTLTEAGDVTVTYHATNGINLTGNFAVPVTYEYYIAGTENLTGSNWSANGLGMTKDGDVYKHTFNNLAAGTYQFKITDGQFNTEEDKTHEHTALGAEYEEVSYVDGNIQIITEEAINLTVIFDATAGKITFENLTEKAPEPTFAYYITGSFNGDDPKKAENGMTLDGTVYKATVTLAEGDNMLKVTDGTWENTWGYGQLGAAYEEVSNPNDGYNNIKITLAAEKEITVIFDATAGKITFEGLTTVETETLVYTVEVPEGTEDCYIAGQMNDWEFERMTQVNATQWTITYDNVLKTTEYKYACQADWAYAEVIDGGGNRTNWSELDEVTAWGKPVVYTYYLMGVDGDWTTGIEMEVNTDAENEVMLTCQPVNGEVKIKRLGDDESEYWYGGKSLKDEPGNLGTNTEAATDGDGNIALEEGIYNFYFNTADGKLWIAAATDCGPATITLTTGDNSAVIAANIGNTVNVVIERSFTANDGYYTLCVPFNMPASVIGKAYSLGTITEHVAGEGININLEEESELSAGVPYLVLPKANMSELVVENVTIESVEASGQNVTGGEDLNVQIFFEGFYSAPGRTTNGTTEYYVGNNGYLYNGEVEIRGLSGLFTITDKNSAPLNVRARVVTREDAATGFENITNSENTTIKLIENGQLIIIRGGEKFNAQGQKL